MWGEYKPFFIGVPKHALGFLNEVRLGLDQWSFHHTHDFGVHEVADPACVSHVILKPLKPWC